MRIERMEREGGPGAATDAYAAETHHNVTPSDPAANAISTVRGPDGLP
jgi:hypothetical protein